MDISELTVGQLREISTLALLPKRKRRTFIPGRYVLVIDRGWILAGDCKQVEDGYIRGDNAVHVFRWESIGFPKMLEEWKSSKVDLRPLPKPFETSEDSIIFRIPVEAGWGLK